MFRSAFTLFLLFLNIAWIALFEYKHFHPSPMPLVANQFLFQQNLLETQIIEIQMKNAPTLKLEKKPSGWELTQPFAWKANPLTIDQYLQTLLSIQPQSIRSVNHFTDFGAYGLKEPLYSIQLTTLESTHQLSIGQSSPTDSKIYAFESKTNQIFVLDASLLQSLHLPLEVCCLPKIFSVENLQTLSLQTPQHTIFLSKNEEEWGIKSPFQAKLGKEPVDNLCQTFLQCTCEHFYMPEEAQAYASKFSDPQQTISIVLGNTENTIYLKLLPIPESANGYIMQRKNEKVFLRVQLEGLETFLKQPETFLSRSLFQLDLSKISKITSKSSTSQTTFQPISEGIWEQTVTYDNLPAHSSKKTVQQMQSILQSLNECFVEQFLYTEPDDIDTPRIDLEILLFSGETKTATFFYKKGITYVKTPENSLTFQLAHFEPDTFLQKLGVQQTVWEWEPDEQVLQVQLRSSNQSNFETIDRKIWETIPLRHLEAAEWLENEIRYPLFSPITYTLRITTEDHEQVLRTYELTFSERIGGDLQTGQYAGKAFRFTAEWIEFLFRITHQKDWQAITQTFLEK